MNPAEQTQATQVGQRLAADFRPLYEALPPSARSGLGLARYLGIDRGTSTRFVGVFAKPIDPMDVLRQFPGPRGLRQLLDAMRERDFPRAALVAAGSTVERFERLLQDFGGSQTKLVERITATRASNIADDPEAYERLLMERRRGLYESAAEAHGQQADLLVYAHAFQPTAGQTELMDHAILRTAFGYRARPDSPPYAIRSYGRNDGPGTLPTGNPGDLAYHGIDEEPAEVDGVPGVTIFREFTSDPVPLVSPRGIGRQGVLLVDAEQANNAKGIDLAIGQHMLGNWRLPIYDTPPRHDVSIFLAIPCRRLVFETYLHRSMARQCVPTMTLYRTTPGVFADPLSRWYDQLPYPPTLQILSCTQTIPSSRYYPRQPELVSKFFQQLRWPLSEFVGYRVEVEYPYWTGFYCMMFDYAQQKELEKQDGGQ